MLTVILALLILAPTPAPKKVHINPRFLTKLAGPNPHGGIVPPESETGFCTNCH